jgi:hypothetical protein
VPGTTAISGNISGGGTTQCCTIHIHVKNFFKKFQLILLKTVTHHGFKYSDYRSDPDYFHKSDKTKGRTGSHDYRRFRIHMAPHHFRKLDPHPHPDPIKVESWIRIRIKVESWIRIRIKVESRIRIRIKVKRWKL